MENLKTNVSLHNLKLIPFVSACSDGDKINPKSHKLSLGRLKGEEASEFYETVISAPPSSVIKNVPNRPRKICKLPQSSFQNNGPLKTTIFHHAQQGNVNGVRNYISNKCNINEEDMFGWTPLMCAAYEGHAAVVELLLENGADRHLKNRQNLTAMDLAEKQSHYHVLDVFQKSQLSTQSIDTNAKHCNSTEVAAKYCNVCSLTYKDTKASHEKSIAHIFNMGKKSDSTFYGIPENNKGFQMMLRSGWNKNKGLGLNCDGRKFPVKTVLKRNRACIGGTKEAAKITHFGPNDCSSVQKHIQPRPAIERNNTLQKRKREKMLQKQRLKEISFRREFYFD